MKTIVLGAVAALAVFGVVSPAYSNSCPEYGLLRGAGQ